MKKIWWEKTIEYLFICRLLKQLDGYFIYPLDGNHEAIGDAIVSFDKYNFLLIEFKRDYRSISNEYKKFDNFNDFLSCMFKKVFPSSKVTPSIENIKKDLSRTIKFHLFIYGQMDEKRKAIDLIYKNYYRYDYVSELHECFTPYKDFNDYINNFLACKNGPSPDGPNNYSYIDNSITYKVVFGISENYKEIITLSLQEYLEQVKGIKSNEENYKFNSA